MKIGDTVRVLADGDFQGWKGEVVRIARSRATNTIGLYIRDHPWSTPPETVWWFDKREVEKLRTQDG